MSTVPNKCNFIITRGCNRGKKCHEIHKYCKNATHVTTKSPIESPELSAPISAPISTHISAPINSQISVQIISNSTESNKIYRCSLCDKTFTLKSNMYRHQKHRCKKNHVNYNNQNYDQIYNQNDEMDENRMDNLNDKTNDNSNINTNYNISRPDIINISDLEDLANNANNGVSNGNSHFSVTHESGNNINQINVNNINNTVNNENNYIQIICVSQKDDFRKILSEKMGESAATKYILDCAKGNLEGDLKLLGKVYFDGKKQSEYPIRFLDRARGKLEFMDESKEFVLDPQGIELTKRICGNLQNGYLTEITRIMGQDRDNKDFDFLDEFDIFNVNNHIYALSDPKYRKKLLNSLGNSCPIKNY